MGLLELVWGHGTIDHEVSCDPLACVAYASTHDRPEVASAAVKLRPCSVA